MFGSQANAKKILPLLFRESDEMFRPSNFYVAFHGEEIVGLLLWKEGSLSWSTEILRRVSVEKDIPVSPHLEQVSKEYVEGYERWEDRISIINLCVADSFL